MKKCIDCKVNPVRQSNRDLCRSCFQKALKEMLKDDKP